MWIPLDSGLRSLCCVVAVAALAACGGSPGPQTGPVPEADDADANRTGAVETLTADELRNQHFTRVEEMIEGRVSGVQVIRLPNGEVSLRIRGTANISGANEEPLVIIDGFPVQQNGIGRALAGINPRDVDKIEVLKDAGSTSFYGVRGANGVIVITTKRR